MFALRLGSAVLALVSAAVAPAPAPAGASETSAGVVPSGHRRLVHLVYAGPKGCDEAARLRDSIQARTPDVSFVSREGGRRVLEVRVEATEAGEWRAHVQEPGSPESGRGVSAESCALVIESLALIISVALAPGGDWSDARDVPAAPPASEPAKVQVPETPAEQPSEPPASSSSARWATGLHGAAVIGATPRVAGGAGVHVAWTRTPERFGSLGVFAGFDATFARTPAQQGAWATSRHLALQLGGCIEALPVGAFRLPACLTGEAAVLSVAGQGLDERRTPSAFLFCAGVALRPALRLTRSLSLDGQLSLLLPTRRPTFYAESPERDVFQVGALQSRIWLGLTLSSSAFR